MVHKELKVFEGSSPREIEHQVEKYGREKGMVPFSVSVVRVNEATKAHKYKAFVIFEGHDVSYPDLGRGSN